MDRVVHQRIQHAARAHLYGNLPCGGKAFCAFGFAQLIQRAGADADGFGGHLYTAAARQMRDKRGLALCRDAHPRLSTARHGGEAKGGGQVVGV